MGLGNSQPETETYYPRGNNYARQTNGHQQQINRNHRPRPTELTQQNKSNRNHQSHNHVKPQKPPQAPQQAQRRHQQQPKTSTERNNNGQSKKKAECNVCGHEGHTGDRCHHRHQTCQICFQPGHLRSVCKQKMHHPDSVYKPKGGNSRPRNNY